MTNLPFLILALILIGSAIGVVASRNPVHSALSLILNLLTVAALFAALDAHFLAVAQVIVYAGAIMVLFVFVLMLLNVKREETKPLSRFLTVFASVAGIGFIVIFARYGELVFGSIERAAPPVVGSVAAIGKLLYTRYTYPFEVASILIIVALAGAVMLARRQYRREVTNDSTGGK